MPPVYPTYARPSMFTQREHYNSQARPVSTHQQQFLDHAASEAEYYSSGSTHALNGRAASHGYSPADVEAGRSRVSNAPITINFDPAKQVPGGSTVAGAMAHDDFYRNSHETGISQAQLSGGGRSQVERNLYDNHYHMTPPHAHPTYGALNVGNSPYGAAPQAGDSYLQLKPEVHQRSTYTHFDSAHANRPEHLGTYGHMDHVLNNTTDHTFHQAMGRPPSSAPDPRGDYIETQIHGRVRLEDDVDRVVAHSRHRESSTGNDLRRMTSNHGGKLYWVDDRGSMERSRSSERPSYGSSSSSSHHGSGGYDDYGSSRRSGGSGGSGGYYY
jgi:hypothetical protein